MMETQHKSIKMPIDLIVELEAIAKQEDLTFSQVVRKAARLYIEQAK